VEMADVELDVRPLDSDQWVQSTREFGRCSGQGRTRPRAAPVSSRRAGTEAE
jgi:hypothetical protein